MSYFDKKLKRRKNKFKQKNTRNKSVNKRSKINVKISKNKRNERLSKRRNIKDTFQNNSFPNLVETTPTIQDLPKLSKLLFSENIDDVKFSTQAIRKLISMEEEEPPIEELFLTKTVPFFVKVLKESEDQFLLVIWTLSNIAGDKIEFRDIILENEGIIDKVLSIIDEKEDINIIEYSIWLLSNLCKDSPHPPLEMIQPCIPLFGKYLKSNDENLIQLCTLGLSEVSDESEENIDAVLKLDCISILIEILRNTSDYTTQLYIIKTLGNLTSGNHLQTEIVLKHDGLLTLLQNLLKNSSVHLQKEICWTISNITAGTSNHISMVIEAGLIEDILEVMKYSNYQIRKECCWILSNAIYGGSQSQIIEIVNEQLIESLSEFLEDEKSGIITICLESYEKILQLGAFMAESQGSNENKLLILFEEYNIITKIENLHNHKKKVIQDLSKRIADNFFN
ncbi:importin alpha [Anaeramoeba flamelloides]|uniref:Importin subunit alpha n=1 Tax=Anaeramoeba flamelloides TaxID=1746091 RepID=A0AAV7Z1V8_9EUKA|nr:importin alpha [Anaeramoeba flamelloides]